MHREGDSLASDDVAQVIVPPPKTLSVLLVSNGNFFIEKLFNVLELKSPDTMIPVGAIGERAPATGSSTNLASRVRAARGSRSSFPRSPRRGAGACSAA